MIKLVSLLANGFKNLDIRNPVEFPPEGNILVIGLNESGKSTFFEAVFFALTGKLLVKEKPNSLVDAINFEKNKAVVKLKFIKNGIPYLIERHVDRTNSGATDYVKFLKLENGGESLLKEGRGKDKQKVQDDIEEVLNFDGDILTNSCFVQQKELDLFLEMSKKEREYVIHKLLGLKNLQELNRQYQQDIKDFTIVQKYFKKKVDFECNLKRIQEIRIKIKDLKLKNKQYQTTTEILEKIREIDLNEIEKLLTRLNTQESQLEFQRNQIETKLVELKNLESIFRELNAKQNKLKFQKESLKKLQERQKGVLFKLEQIEEDLNAFNKSKQEKTEIQEKLTSIVKEINKYENDKKIVQKIESDLQDISDLKKELMNAEKNKENILANFLLYEKKLNENLGKNIEQIKENITIQKNLEQSIERIEHDIQGKKAKLMLLEQFQILNRDADKIKNEILENRQKSTENLNQIEILEKSILDLNNFTKIIKNNLDLTRELKVINSQIVSWKLYLEDLERKLENKKQEWMRAEQEIHKMFLKRMEKASSKTKIINQTVMLLLMTIGGILSIFGAFSGVFFNLVLFSLIGLGTAIIIFGILLGQQLLPVKIIRDEIKEVINEFHYYLSISPDHESKFLTPMEISTGKNIKEIRTLMESQIRKLGAYSDSQTPKKLQDSFYFNHSNDYNFRLYEEIKEIQKRKELAIRSPSVSPEQQKKTEIELQLKQNKSQISEIILNNKNDFNEIVKLIEAESPDFEQIKQIKELLKKQIESKLDTLIENNEEIDFKIKELENKLKLKEEKTKSFNLKGNPDELIKEIQIDIERNREKKKDIELKLSLCRNDTQTCLEIFKSDFLPKNQTTAELEMWFTQKDLDRLKEMCQEHSLVEKESYTLEKWEIYERKYHFLGIELEELKEIFKDIHNKTELIITLKEQIDQKSSIKEENLRKLDGKYKDNLDDFKKDFNEISKKRAALEGRLKEISKNLEEYDRNELEKHKSQKKKEETEIRLQIQESDKPISELEASIIQIKSKIPLHDVDLDEIKRNIENLNIELNENSSEKSKVETEKRTTIDNAIKKLDHLQKSLQKFAEITNLKQDLEPFISIIYETDTFVNLLTSSKNLLESISDKLVSNAEELKKTLMDELDIADEKGNFSEKISEILHEPEVLEDRNENLKKEMQEIEKKKNIKEMINLKLEKNSKISSKELLKAISYELNIKEKAMEIVTEASSDIIKLVMPTTRQYLARVLPLLTADRYKDIDISQDNRGKFRVRVFDSSKKEYVEKVMFSGGTNDQIALSIRLAFALAVMGNTSYAESFIFLDEPLGFFDDERKNCLIDFLTRGWIAEKFSQRFVVSNFSSIRKHFDYIIELDNGRVIREVPTRSPFTTELVPEDENEPVSLLNLDLAEHFEEDGVLECVFHLINTSEHCLTRIELNCDAANFRKTLHEELKPKDLRKISLNFNRNALIANILVIDSSIHYGEEIASQKLQFDLENKVMVGANELQRKLA